MAKGKGSKGSKMGQKTSGKKGGASHNSKNSGWRSPKGLGKN